MSFPRIFRKFAISVSGVILVCSSLGCSGSESTPGGSAGSPGSGGSPGAAGSAGAGTSGSSGSAAVAGASGSDEQIGAFQVGIEAATSEVDVLGRVSDGPLAPVLLWDLSKEDGDCQLLIPNAPFCDPGCGADICQPNNVCVPYPVGQNVGEVTLSGVRLESGETTLVLKEVAKNYQPPPNTVFAYPPFSEGDDVGIRAAGGDYPGFELIAPAVAPLLLTSEDFALEEGKAFELTWDAAGSSSSRVHVKLDISHHGGTKGKIECDTADDGTLSISAEMMTDLIGLGVAGFPTVELTRVSTATTSIPQGRLQLVVSAFVGQAVTIAGLDSCNATTCEGSDDPQCLACPDGLTCESDLTCQ